MSAPNHHPRRRILLVEDEPDIVRGLSDVLEFEGFDVSSTGDGRGGVRLMRERGADCVILDLMLPDLNGYQVCEEIRGFNPVVPIIILTARGQESDKIRGLEAGADDYITKPVVPKELAARIMAHLRRVQLHSEIPTTGRAERFGDVELRRDQAIVVKAGRELALTKTEYRLMCEFADHPNMVLSRDQLLERVWGYDYLGDSRLVDAHVRRLRVKVEDQPDDPRLIVTVRGIGYRLIS